MAVQLAGIDREAAERARREAARKAAIDYSGAALLADVRAALARESKRYRLSEPEADALAQEVAARALSRPDLTVEPTSGELKPRDQRREALAGVVRWLCRDSREWLDSVDGWRPREQAERTESGGRKSKRPSAALALSTVEQAERFRAWEREHDSRMAQTSLDALIARHRIDDDDDGPSIDFLAIAAHQAREREVGHGLPAAAVAEHNRVLTRSLARRLAAESGAPEKLLRAALYVHAGENAEAVALAERVSVATLWRRSSAGSEALRELGAEPIRQARRSLAASLGLAPADHGPILGELESIAARAVSRAQRQAQRPPRKPRGARWQTVATARGRRARIRPVAVERWHGSPREVLAYIAAVERTLSAGAWTFLTHDARPAPAHGPNGWRHPATARPGASLPSEPLPLPRGAWIAARCIADYRSGQRSEPGCMAEVQRPEREAPPVRVGRTTYHAPLKPILYRLERGALAWGARELSESERGRWLAAIGAADSQS